MQNLQKENISNVRTKAAIIPQDGLAKRRHLSVVDNNEQVRKLSVDCEDKCKSRKNGVKSEPNEKAQDILKNQHEREEKKDLGKVKVDKAVTESSELLSTKILPNLPEGVINIDQNDDMSDYGADIVSHLKEREKAFTLHEDFLEENSVTESMRSILVDWLIQASQCFVWLC